MLDLALLLSLSPCLWAPAALQAPAEPAGDEQVLLRGVEYLLSAQEGGAQKDEGPAEWPYEGVYRVRGEIPIGYRVGGTGICTLALIHAPGFEEDTARQAAVQRAVEFLTAAIEHPLMTPDYNGGYDVRGWGYCYGLHCLLRLQELGRVPKGMDRQVEKAARFYSRALQDIAIPRVGGWNYARERGLDTPSSSSPFMTSACLQALFAADAAGHRIDPGVVGRALDALERSRTTAGAMVYSLSPDNRQRRDQVPGATGRMPIAESTLYLAGRSTPAAIRGALDAFFTHWEWLEKRRKQTGTHVGPYGVAPYYFYFAHHYAAQAIELLPDTEREEYRRLFRETLFRTRDEDGTWNDRVFARSANYGTAMSMLALQMPELPAPAGWARGLKTGR